MVSPDPVVQERNYYLSLLNYSVDDPSISLASLKEMSAGGANAHIAANTSGLPGAFGIDGNGTPYYDPDLSVPAGERAIPQIVDGAVELVKNGSTYPVLTEAYGDTRYLQVNEGPLDPARYGAVGDGVTVDRTAINNAIAAMSTGQTMRFRPGKTYIVDGMISHKQGITIEGYGATIKVKPGTTPSYNVFQPSSVISILGLTIDLNKSNTTDPGFNTQGAGVYMSASSWSGALLRDVTVQNGWQIGIRYSSTNSITDALNALSAVGLIDNCILTNVKYGIWLSNCWGMVIRNPRVSSTIAEGIYDSLCRDTQVIGGSVRSAGGHGFFSQYGHGTIVKGLTVVGSTLTGITFGGGSTTNIEGRNYTINGCTSKGNTLHGITLDPTKTGASGINVPVHASLGGNICDGNTIHGINVTNGQYIAMNGNTCRNNVGSGIGIAGHSVAVSGNVCTGNLRGIAMYGNAGAPNYGSHRVGMNVVTPNTTSTYYVESASVTGVQFASYTATAPE